MSHPHRRVRFLFMTVLFVFSIFGAQLVRLQALDASALATAALDQRLDKVTVPAMRGDILDANGVVLATSIERRNVTADQIAVREYTVGGVKIGVDGAAKALAPLVGKSEAELATVLTGSRRFTYVAKGVTPLTWRTISKLGIPGIYSETTSSRSYPTSSAAASLVGWVGADGIADKDHGGGLELLYNKQLEGKPGQSTYERSLDGRVIPTGEQQVIPPVPGRDLKLTINSDVQWYAQNAIAQKVNQTQALSGTVVVMRVKTGELVAVASYPTFDPANITRAGTGLNNTAFDDAFEPGSTAKVMTAASALQEGVATPSTPVTIPNRLKRADQLFRDSHDHPTEHLTFAGVIAQSSNIGTMLVGEKVPPAKLEQHFRDFGVGQHSGIGFPGETAGLFARSSDWNGSQRYTVMYGQGLSVNAIQAAGVFQTIANGGVRIPPKLVSGTENADGALTSTPSGAPVRVVSQNVATQLSQMLEFVVGDGGTARQAKIDGYRVAGKTGTADRIGADGRYSGGGKTASFIGFAPADKPEYVVAVILQKPIKGYYGGSTAGPVFKDVMTYVLQELQVPPTGTPPPTMKLTVEQAPTSADKAEAALAPAAPATGAEATSTPKPAATAPKPAATAPKPAATAPKTATTAPPRSGGR